MANIYLSKEEKDRIITIMETGDRAGRRLTEVSKKVSAKRDKYLSIIKDVKAKSA